MMEHSPSELGTEALASDHDELTAETLIEEVSIDGMCGVY